MKPAILCAVPNPPPTVRTLLEVYYRFMGWSILYVSPRPDTDRPEVETWLQAHHCPPGPLIMPGSPHPTGYEVKFVLGNADHAWGYPTLNYEEATC